MFVSRTEINLLEGTWPRLIAAREGNFYCDQLPMPSSSNKSGRRYGNENDCLARYDQATKRVSRSAEAINTPRRASQTSPTAAAAVLRLNIFIMNAKFVACERPPQRWGERVSYGSKAEFPPP